MRRNKQFFIVVAVLVFCIFASPSFAILVPPYIEGTSTATLIVGGARDGWYYYEMEINWDLDGTGAGLSHLDMILGLECAELDHLVEFDSPAGFSTTETEPTNPTAMGWTGYFERDGDPTSGEPNPAIKFNDPYFPGDAEPGSDGYGTFSFYSNIVPADGTLADALFAKSGSGAEDVFGDLVGDYPSCTIVPEPATIMLLCIGSLVVCRGKRRR
jgi:hypothetical protein